MAKIGKAMMDITDDFGSVIHANTVVQMVKREETASRHLYKIDGHGMTRCLLVGSKGVGKNRMMRLSAIQLDVPGEYVVQLPNNPTSMKVDVIHGLTEADSGKKFNPGTVAKTDITAICFDPMNADALDEIQSYAMSVMQASRAIEDETRKVTLVLVACVADEANMLPETWEVDQDELLRFEKKWGGGPPDALDVHRLVVSRDSHRSVEVFLKQLFDVAYEVVEDHNKVDELKEVFTLIDTDKSGAITTDEFYELLCMVGMSENITREESDNIIREVDEDGTGGIEFGEFLKVMRRKPVHSHDKQEVLRAFEDLCLGGAVTGLHVGECRLDLLKQWLIAYRPGNDRYWNTVDERWNLSQPQILEFKEAFNLFDRDLNGHIDKAELKHVMEKLGQNPTEQEVDQLLAEVDSNSNGKIEVEEFLALMSTKMKQKDDEEEIKEAFKVFDRDGNGVVDAKELKIVMKSLEHLEDAEVDDMIRSADQDGDGNLNYEEFVTFMRKTADGNSNAQVENTALGSDDELAATIKEEIGSSLTIEEVIKMLERAELHPDSAAALSERIISYNDFLFENS